MSSQECPGGLGDNLFEDGDFGTGSSFVLLSDPLLAPGYQYIFDGAPGDGQYLITNDMTQWSFVFDTWLIIQDNSPDPQGYMMVVNASFEPGLFYEEQVEGLCDNTTYEFSADIINMIRRGVQNHSDPNVDFLIDEEVVLRTGNIAKNEQWNTFSFSFDTAPGQTSVTLSLRNNAPGGVGNDLALDNISFRACGPRSEISTIGDIEDVICIESLPITLSALQNGVENPDKLYEWEQSIDRGSTWAAIPDESSSRLVLDERLAIGNMRRYSYPIWVGHTCKSGPICRNIHL